MGTIAFLAMLTVVDARGRSDLQALLVRPDVAGDEPTAAVAEIIAAVRAGGDATLAELTARFDGVESDAVRVPADVIDAAYGSVDPAVIVALEFAAESIRAFHATQVSPEHTFTNPLTGVTVRSIQSPVRRAGCYVPGGRASYPSTVLMTAIPAMVAGVSEVALCVPPSREHGQVSPVTLAAAKVAGVSEVYAVGGAQAIAAMAYGTESIRPVDVICGPGNRYVAIAQRQVAGAVGIAAAFAGPSEVVVVADGTVDPELVAIDIMVQAEHGPDGLGWLVSWDRAVIDAVCAEIERLTAAAPRAAEIAATLASAGYAVLVDGPEEARAVVDFIAPEHLQVMCADGMAFAEQVHNAGAVFVGEWAPASLGDYTAGPSHVLPTHSTARFASVLSVDDFCRHQHIVTIDGPSFDVLAHATETLAAAEGLDAHAESVRLRAARRAEAGPAAAGAENTGDPQ